MLNTKNVPIAKASERRYISIERSQQAEVCLWNRQKCSLLGDIGCRAIKIARGRILSVALESYWQTASFLLFWLESKNRGSHVLALTLRCHVQLYNYVKIHLCSLVKAFECQGLLSPCHSSWVGSLCILASLGPCPC